MAQWKATVQTERKAPRGKKSEKNGQFEPLTSFRNVTSFFQQLERDPYSLRFSLDARKDQNKKKDRRKRKKTGRGMLDSQKISQSSGVSGHSLFKKKTLNQQDQQLKTVFKSQGILPSGSTVLLSSLKLKSQQYIKPLPITDDSLPRQKKQLEKYKCKNYKKKKRINPHSKASSSKLRPSQSIKLTHRQIHRLERIFEIEGMMKTNQEKNKQKSTQSTNRR